MFEDIPANSLAAIVHTASRYNNTEHGPTLQFNLYAAIMLVRGV